MNINLSNYKKIISASILKAGKILMTKQAIRELDEETKGLFVAYVDEGNDSRDVTLSFDAENNLMEHSCDCGSEYFFCEHKAAVLLHLIENGKSVKAPKVKKVKPNKDLILFEHIEKEQLIEWLLERFNEDKPLRVIFENRFLNANKTLSPQEITLQLDVITKSTIGRKKKLEASEVKILVKLWSEFEKPFTTKFFNNIYDEKMLLAFNALLDYFYVKQKSIVSTSTRIHSYVENFYNILQNYLLNIIEEDEFKRCVNYFSLQYTDVKVAKYTRMYYLVLVKAAKQVSEVRKTLIQKIISEQFLNNKIHCTELHEELYKTILNLLSDSDYLMDVIDKLKPLTHENDYNVSLIQGLIKLKYKDRAIKYCQSIIQSNYYEEYNVPYYELLGQIYLAKNNTKLAVPYLKSLLFYKPNIEHYKIVMTSFNETKDATNYRNRLLNRLQNTMYAKIEIQDFYFAMLADEGKHKKMIEECSYKIHVKIILDYFDIMLEADRLAFLKALLPVQFTSYSYHGSRNESHLKDELIRSIDDNFKQQEITLFVMSFFKHDYASYRPIPELVAYYTKLFKIDVEVPR